MDNATLTLVIAIVGCLVGLAGWYRNSTHDSEENARKTSSIETKLDFIAEDVKDTKAEIRSFRGELSETKTVANTALARADAAHDRLDALEAPSAHASRKEVI